MGDLSSRLQAAVGDTYRIEKELGGGGMSRVFLAEEVALERRVVIKLLPPEMAAGVSVERFEREIKLAAKLQHPHIVPLLTAGSKDDLLFYVMPYIEGESLRAKLTREGELPVGEAVRILKEVIDALSYAHSHGIVHRDIKPDNVLVSGKHAVVTDFGVAKAVSSSTAGQSLTSMGIALGTPAYMAPEQAAADPHVDHRADVYAVGVLAYEMLTGQPPFTGPNPQAVLSAHMTQAPDAVSMRRSTVPAALDGLIMRCLEKKAADRWQHAEELLPHLEAMTTPSGGMTPTGTQPMAAMTTSAAKRAVNNAQPLRVMGLFGLASVGALAIVYFLVQLIGLPDWVFYGAIGLLVVGFPIVLLTGHREKQRAFATMTEMSIATPVGLERHFTWRKSLIGGGLAFVGLAAVAGTYMAMRVMGIGPVGTLVASGVLDEGARIILADFADRAGDSLTATAVTEAFRVDLSQSPILTLMSTREMRAVLVRMDRDPATRLDAELAREIALREGVKGVIAGEINVAGTGYVLSARVIDPRDGEDLVAFRETAKDAGQIIPAIDRLSRQLRERIGESLRTIRANPPLDRVSTASLEALQKYSEAIRAEVAGNIEMAVALVEQAIAIDTGFAMAYRKLGTILIGRDLGIGAERARWAAALRKAFAHRSRLTDVELYTTLGTYYYYVEGDREQAITAYKTLLRTHPNNGTALNNLSIIYGSMGRHAEAEELLLRLHALESKVSLYYTNAAFDQIAMGKLDAADTSLSLLAERVPGVPTLERGRANLAFARGRYNDAEQHMRTLREQQVGNLRWRAETSEALGNLARVRGRAMEAEQHFVDEMAANVERGLEVGYVQAAIADAKVDVLLRNQNARGVATVAAALKRYPLDSMPPLARPYIALARFYAQAQRPGVARQMLAAYVRDVDAVSRRLGEGWYHGAVGVTALAEGSYDEAIEELRAWDEGVGCPTCALADLGRAYDLSGQSDSALAVYEQLAVSPSKAMWASEALPGVYTRLGELYEQKGNSDKAIEYYNKFVELWSDADEELQPQVKDVRDRIARLVGER